MLSDFHFLRPWCLLGLCILFFLPYISSQITQKDSPWYKIADSFLLKSQLFGTNTTQKRSILKLLILFCWTLTVIGISGPSWDKKEFDIVSTKANFIIISEMSPNMLADDIKPSRLMRMQYKLYDLLDKTKDNNVAMIVYDNFPYIISPFTSDNEIIRNFVKVFDVNMMPALGANLNNALQKGLDIAKNYKNSNFIVFIAGNNYDPANALSLAKKIKDNGNTLSVIAIGNEFPIPINDGNGGFVKNETGKTVTTKLDYDFLKTLATTGGGSFSNITPDDSDINGIISLADEETKKQTSTTKVEQWRDMGVYIPIIIAPFALLLFKRSFLLTILILQFLNSSAHAFSWDDLWLNSNQQGQKLLSSNPEIAADKFKDKSYKAAAQYKSKQYEKAVKNFTEQNQMYNAGTTLAHMGKIDEAVKIYEELLKTEPDHKDAKFNLEYLKKLQQPNKQSQKQSQGQNKQKNTDNQQEQKQNQNQSQGQAQKSPDSWQRNDNQNNQSQQQNQMQDDNASKSDPQQGWDVKEDTDTDQQNKNKTGSKSGKAKQGKNAKKKQWLDDIESDPYGLLKEKLRLIYETEYNK